MRGGPGLGGIQAGQGDYFQATQGGGHGDYHIVVFAPASVQEMATSTVMSVAFDTGRQVSACPVMILADGMIGQMMEPVVLPEMKEYKVDLEKKPWAANGHGLSKKSGRSIINSLYLNHRGPGAEHNERPAGLLPRDRGQRGPLRGLQHGGRRDRASSPSAPSRVSPRAPLTSCQRGGHQGRPDPSHHPLALPDQGAA